MNQIEMAVVQRFYEAQFDPNAYGAAMDLFGRQFPDVRLALQVEQTGPRRMAIETVAANMDPDALVDYEAVAHLNPFVDFVATAMHSDRLYRTDEWISREAVRNSEFFEHFLGPRDRMDSSAGFNIYREPDLFAFFAVTIPERLSEDDRDSLYGAVDRIRPHVQRSFRLARDLMRRTAIGQTGSLIERAGTPVAVFDATHRLVVENSKAKRFFQVSKDLSLSRRGTLLAREKKVTDLLSAAADTTATTTLPVGPIRIPRAVNNPLIVYFVPAGQAGSLNPIVEPFKEGFPAYLLFVLDPDEVDPAPAEILTAALGLTPAEARLAQMIYEGNSVREAAEGSSTAYATARNQLASITRKLDLKRQSDLTGLIARLMARRPR